MSIYRLHYVVVKAWFSRLLILVGIAIKHGTARGEAKASLLHWEKAGTVARNLGREESAHGFAWDYDYMSGEALQ